jgi:hypothetical protein
MGIKAYKETFGNAGYSEPEFILFFYSDLGFLKKIHCKGLFRSMNLKERKEQIDVEKYIMRIFISSTFCQIFW